MTTSISYEQTLVYGNMRGEVFYRTPAWRRARYLALTTYGNRCHLCGAGPSTGPLQVDHILPRSLHPERCLDPTNLQVLCEACHLAKGLVFFDDCRAKLTKEVRALRDFFRLERRHLLVGRRPPTSAELGWLGEGVRSTSKKHRSRWRLFMKYCCMSQQTYEAARRVTVGEFLLTPWANRHDFAKFLHSGTAGRKASDDLLFDIDGCHFPSVIGALLADDQREQSE